MTNKNKIIAPKTRVIRYEVNSSAGVVRGNCPTTEAALKQVMHWIEYCTKNEIKVYGYHVSLYEYDNWIKGLITPSPKIVPIENVKLNNLVNAPLTKVRGLYLKTIE